MSKCPACQVECTPGSRFCLECGASLSTVEAPQPTPISSSFGVVQSAMAAQEASLREASLTAASATVRIAPSAKKVAPLPVGSAKLEPARPLAPKLLKVDLSKKVAPKSQSIPTTQPLSNLAPGAPLQHPFSPATPLAVASAGAAAATSVTASAGVAAVTSTGAAAAKAAPLEAASKPAAVGVGGVANSGGSMPKDTGELRQWVERSVAQWSDNASEGSPNAPMAAPRLTTAQLEPSPTQGQSGASVAAAAPFSAAKGASPSVAAPTGASTGGASFSAPSAAAAAPLAPPSVVSSHSAAPNTSPSPKALASSLKPQPPGEAQLKSIAREEQDNKANKSFYSGLVLGCCGGVVLAAVSIFLLIVFIGAAINK